MPIVVAAWLACTGPALAGPRLRVSRTVVVAGQRIVVSGSVAGCPRGDAVTIISKAFRSRAEFAGLPAVSARVGRGGRFSTGVTIGRVLPGYYRVGARCGGGDLGTYAVLLVRRH